MASQKMSRRLLRSAATLAAAMVFYYFVPLPDERLSIVGVLLFLAGMAALMLLVLLQARHQLRAPENESVRLNSLLVVLYLVIVFFSLAYVQIERLAPGEFAELETRTDALYFTVTTLGTVGYGDVHAVGQMARIFVTAQIVFDVVFVALLVSVFSHRVGRVVAARRVSGGD
jgi:voltage-gated potassium channel